MKQRSFVTYLLLSIITCGIYSIYFWWFYVKDINQICVSDGKESPNYIVVLLLSIVTLGIYSLYWYYTQANRLQAAGSRYGVTVQENGTTVLLWMLLGSFLCGVGPFVATYFMIKNLNQLAAAHSLPR